MGQVHSVRYRIAETVQEALSQEEVRKGLGSVCLFLTVVTGVMGAIFTIVAYGQVTDTVTTFPVAGPCLLVLAFLLLISGSILVKTDQFLSCVHKCQSVAESPHSTDSKPNYNLCQMCCWLCRRGRDLKLTSADDDSARLRLGIDTRRQSVASSRQGHDVQSPKSRQVLRGAKDESPPSGMETTSQKSVSVASISLTSLRNCKVHPAVSSVTADNGYVRAAETSFTMPSLSLFNVDVTEC